ncbi:hypothetical protein HDU98_003118 [Podochytrium sp. JEL0797]|nr:hypothetical protein HDU98_003118 [Podochytrium sp. JEL0797]
MAVTVQQVCNKSPVIWDTQNTYCAMISPLLQTIYKGKTGILLDSNSTHMYGSLWYQDKQQFMCELTDCAQKIENGVYSNVCQSGTCKCNGNSAFCGGPGTMLSIKGTIESASGGSTFKCDMDGTNCNLRLNFLDGLFPTGMPMSDCAFGECAYESQNPYLTNVDVKEPLSPAGIAGSAVAGVLGFGAIVIFVWSYLYQIRARKEPVPPPRQGANIEFSDITYTLPTGKVLLDGITSSASAGQLTAIMGPSGAGKSTLLDILAGKDKRGEVTGSLIFDGVEFNPKDASKIIAYVDQDDLLLPSMTVRETLLFSAKLRLAEGMSDQEKLERVDQTIETLGLSHVANSRVGGFGLRGISGGERRRVSIGVELVTSPGILFLDEPTSGLDSFNAHAVIEALHRLAHDSNKTIVFTVHQPRSDMFAMFDQVIVLAAGTTMFSAKGVDAAQLLKEDGHPCPDGYNIADHLLDLAIQVPREAEADAADAANSNSFKLNIGGSTLRKRVTVKSTTSNSSSASKTKTTAPRHLETSCTDVKPVVVGFLTQLTELVRRSFRHLIRTPSLLYGHIGLSVFMGVFVGGLYFDSGDSIAGFQNRLGCLLFICSLIGFSSLSAIGSMAQERNLFIRERSNGVYGSFPYYISKIMCDVLPLRVLPGFILGTIAFWMCGFTSSGNHFPRFLALLLPFSAIMGLTCICIAVSIPDIGAATLVGAIVILFKMLFAGMIISQDSIPEALRWIQYLSFFKYPYEGMVVNDMGLLELQDSIDGTAVSLPASLILEKFGFDINNYGKDLLITIIILVLLLVLTGVLIDVRLKERR